MTLNDLTGQTFGRLYVIKRSKYKHPKGKVFWDCECSCGNYVRVVSWNLTSGMTSSCGCLNKDIMSKIGLAKREDLTGKKFHRLTVLEYVKTNKYVKTVWRCQCDCGNIIEVVGSDLRNGQTRTCGCRGLSVGESAFNAVYEQYRRNAYNRGFSFDLSKDEFRKLTNENCYYCGHSPTSERKMKSSRGNYIYNGIDRVDNTLGYVLENCVTCCDMCNKAKNKHSKDDFLNWISSVFVHSVQMNKAV